jgi:chromosome partitioning protein
MGVAEMIVVIGGIKGGVGKTTTAVNLAVMRSKERDVLLIDADQQGSATDFTAVRNDTVEGGAGYTAVQLFGRAVRTDGLTLSTKYEDVIIDVGGRDTSSQRSALTIADKLILPVLPSSFDIWSLGPLHTLLEEIFPVNEKLEVLAFNWPLKIVTSKSLKFKLEIESPFVLRQRKVSRSPS